MRFSPSSAVLFALGFFALAAQTLLFRDFLTVFEGSELGIACFFCSWLVWICVGALVGNSRLPLNHTLADRFEWLPLFYIPLYLIQQWLVSHSRAICGVESYETFPFASMMAVSLLTNSPVSFWTGYLFTSACRWKAEEHVLPVARVYVLETFGSFFGAVGVTWMLVWGNAPERVFLLSAIVVAVAVAVYAVLGGAPGRSRESGRKPWVPPPPNLPLKGEEMTPLPWREGLGEGADCRPWFLRKKRWIGGLVPFAVLLAALGFGLDSWWSRKSDLSSWTNLLPVEAFSGSFSTAQSRYLYGEYENDFVVVSWGGTCETLPNREHASEIVALTLSQNPKAKKVLVIGEDSLSICRRLLDLPRIEEVTWLHPDPQYSAALWEVLPSRFKPEGGRLQLPDKDAAQFLTQTTSRYDIAILNLPDPTTLILNRFSTVEFQRHLKGVLAEEGIVCLRFSGGANYLGEELAYLGASFLTTLEAVYKNSALKPGDESWLMASDGDSLSQSAPILRDRFAALERADGVFPSENLLSLYLPDRVEFQLGRYNEVIERVGSSALTNTDRMPRGLQYSLLLALRQTGVSWIEAATVFSRGGVWVFLSAIVLFAVLRGIYIQPSVKGREPKWPGVEASASLRGAVQKEAEAFNPTELDRSPGTPSRDFEEVVPAKGCQATSALDSGVLILSAGMAGISMNLFLLFQYQSRFGSLFLEVGLVTALFMLGAFIAGWGVRRFLAGHGLEPFLFLPAIVVAHLVFVLVTASLPGQEGKALFHFLFVLSGAFTGVYFPLAAYRLSLEGKPPHTSGAILEFLDHAGGALGAFLAGLVLIPVLGSRATLGLVAALMAANLVVHVAAPKRRKPRAALDAFDRRARQAGYAMLGIGAFFLLSSQILASIGAQSEGRRLLLAAREMAGGIEPEEQSTQTDRGTLVPYYILGSPGDATAEYFYGSRPLEQSQAGFAGPIHLAIDMDREGVLQDFRIIDSNETPAYLQLLSEWFRSLSGRNLFQQGAFEDVDAVSGATLTSAAVMRTLEGSGKAFGKEVLEIGLGESELVAASGWVPDKRFAALLVLTIAALSLHLWPRKWLRRLLLLAALVVAGWYFNSQFSAQQVVSLLSLQWPSWGLTGTVFLVVVVPLLVLFFGNLYCGYLCPFGALQELIGDLRPKRLQTDPDKKVWRYGRLIKYLLLLLVVVSFSLTRNPQVLSADPLLTFFGEARDRSTVALVVCILVASFFFRRFWCRNLCPAGAFLSLLGGAKLLRRWLPATHPPQCDLGVRGKHELDCLQCDRCRDHRHLHLSSRHPRESGNDALEAGAPYARPETVFLAAVLVFATVFSGMTFIEVKNQLQLGRSSQNVALGVAGVARDVDMRKLERLMKQGYLSDRKALYYSEIPAVTGTHTVPFTISSATSN